MYFRLICISRKINDEKISEKIVTNEFEADNEPAAQKKVQSMISYTHLFGQKVIYNEPKELRRIDQEERTTLLCNYQTV